MATSKIKKTVVTVITLVLLTVVILYLQNEVFKSKSWNLSYIPMSAEEIARNNYVEYDPTERLIINYSERSFKKYCSAPVNQQAELKVYPFTYYSEINDLRQSESFCFSYRYDITHYEGQEMTDITKANSKGEPMKLNNIYYNALGVDYYDKKNQTVHTIDVKKHLDSYYPDYNIALSTYYHALDELGPGRYLHFGNLNEINQKMYLSIPLYNQKQREIKLMNDDYKLINGIDEGRTKLWGSYLNEEMQYLHIPLNGGEDILETPKYYEDYFMQRKTQENIFNMELLFNDVFSEAYETNSGFFKSIAYYGSNEYHVPKCLPNQAYDCDEILKVDQFPSLLLNITLKREDAENEWQYLNKYASLDAKNNQELTGSFYLPQNYDIQKFKEVFEIEYIDINKFQNEDLSGYFLRNQFTTADYLWIKDVNDWKGFNELLSHEYRFTDDQIKDLQKQQDELDAK